MAEWICEHCGVGFKRDRAGERKIRFCSQECYHAWRKENKVSGGQFIKGTIPWNKDIKGIHLSPETEFKPGHKSNKILPVGTVRIRTYSRNGRQRAWIKTAEPNTWELRCRVVWEENFGKIPDGLVIHHIDRNTLNDEVTNLAAISRAAHMNEHRAEIRKKFQDNYK